MSKEKQFCNATLKTCEAHEMYCTDYHLVSDQKEEHGKGCGAASACEKTDEACEKRKKDYNLTSCDLFCCQGNACNKGFSTAVQGMVPLFLIVVSFYLLI